MFKLLGTCVFVYAVFRFLDWLFRPKQKQHGKRFAIQDTHGDWYIVEETEEKQQPDIHPGGNVVKFKGKGHR